MELVKTKISDYLKLNARELPGKTAAVFCEPNVEFTWKDLKNKVDEVSRAFLAMGIGRSSHVAIWGTNVPEWMLTQYAVNQLGGIIITINPEWKAKEVHYALKQSDTEVLVMIEGYSKQSGNKTFRYDYMEILENIGLPKAKNIQDALPNLKEVIVISEKEWAGMMNWKKFLERSKEISTNQLNEEIDKVHYDDTLMIQYTSGTTGFPKGAMLTHYNVINNARTAANHMKFGREDILCGPVPFYHCFGSILVNIGCLVTGATAVIPYSTFDAHKTLEAIEKYKCSILYGVPTMFIAELEDMDFDSFDLGSLRSGIMAGAPVDKELFEAVTLKMGAKEMTIAYGLTETSPVTHQTEIVDPIDARISSVGNPVEHTEAKIVDPKTLEELEDGEVGEIWVKGFHVMKGYYNKPEETENTILDGWLRSGDLGIRDDRGFYKIVGRLKEMIIVGGHNVYPVEVEQALFSLLEDKVEMLQVVGLPHKKLQEMVGLAVKCKPGKTIGLEEIKIRCEGQLEWPKIPRYVMLVDDFSNVMTVTGKIQKFKLKKLMEEEMEKALMLK
jgi:fatty-acyl-CoA synthase